MSDVPSVEYRAHEYHTPWFVLTLLGLAVVSAALAFAASLASYQYQQDASATDVAANRELIRQVQTLQEVNAAEVHEHRERNEQIHACIVKLLTTIAQAADNDTSLAGGLPTCPAALPDFASPEPSYVD